MNGALKDWWWEMRVCWFELGWSAAGGLPGRRRMTVIIIIFKTPLQPPQLQEQERERYVIFVISSLDLQLMYHEKD
jgi:hypothetical protein